jgi:hypothetical protein
MYTLQDVSKSVSNGFFSPLNLKGVVGRKANRITNLRELKNLKKTKDSLCRGVLLERDGSWGDK